MFSLKRLLKLTEDTFDTSRKTILIIKVEVAHQETAGNTENTRTLNGIFLQKVFGIFLFEVFADVMEVD